MDEKLILKRVPWVGAAVISCMLAAPSLAAAQSEGGGAAPDQTTEASAPEPEVTEPVEVTDEGVASGASVANDASPNQIEQMSTEARDIGPKAQVKGKGKGKRAGAARKCSKGSKKLAQAAPPAGCTSLNGSTGTIVLPDGTTLNITEPSTGTVNFTVTGGPTGTFTGTLLITHGRGQPGISCTFSNVTAGSCGTLINPSNGKPFGVNHVDACPPNTPPGSQGQVKGKSKKRKAKAPTEDARIRPAAAVATEARVARGEELAFTGLEPLWLLLIGAGLLSSGLALRRMGQTT